MLVRAGSFETTYGIGVVHVIPYNYFFVEFWKTPKDAIPYDRLYFYRDTVPATLRCGFATTGDDSIPAWFRPEALKLSKSLRLDMFCIEKDEDWCKVVVNRLTGETKWVQLGMDIKFMDWNTLFHSVKSVKLVTEDAALYEQASKKWRYAYDAYIID
jgi:hypothetical protein